MSCFPASHRGRPIAADATHPVRAMGAAMALIFALGLVMAMGETASAQGLRGNAAKGRGVAETQCGECHGIGFEGFWMRSGVPSFPVIADLPSTTALRLRAALQTTHTRTRMPNLLLTRADTDDVIAYILSLAQK